jgi:hypothetical protein
MSDDPFRDVYWYEDVVGVVLIAEFDQATTVDVLSIAITYEYPNTSLHPSDWMRLERHQAIELAEAILHRFGSSDPSL